MYCPKHVILLYLIIPSLIFSQKFSPPEEEKFSDKVIYLTFNSQFDEALNLADKMLAGNPSSLKWKYFHAIILFRNNLNKGYINSLGISDKKDFNLEVVFKESIDELKKVAELGEDAINKNSKDTLAIFYTGAAYGYIGMYYAAEGSFFKAMSEGKKGINLHDKLIKMCPRWNDVYYSQAVLNFYSSNVPWYIKPFLWILGQSGTEAKAEFYLKKVANWGNYAKYAAKEFLFKLYIRQKKYDEAFEVIESLSKELPNNRYQYAKELLYQLEKNDNLTKVINFWQTKINQSKSENLTELNKVEIAHLYLAITQNLDEKTNVNERLALFKELLERNLVPKYHPWCHLGIGSSYRILNKPEEAVKHYKWVIENGVSENQKKYAEEKLAELNIK
ncbi:MAG: hypothetical protein AB1775_09665 [Bacteroidota bacterium]